MFAGIHKLGRPGGATELVIALLRRHVQERQPLISRRLIGRGSALVRAFGAFELILGITLLQPRPGPMRLASSVTAAVVFLTFVCVSEFARRREVPCGCFGGLSTEAVERMDVARVGLFALMSIAVLVGDLLLRRQHDVSAVAIMVAIALATAFVGLMIVPIYRREVVRARKLRSFFNSEGASVRPRMRIDRTVLRRVLASSIGRSPEAMADLATEKRNDRLRSELVDRAQDDAELADLLEILRTRFSCPPDWQFALAYDLALVDGSGEPAVGLRVALTCGEGNLVWIPRMPNMGVGAAVATLKGADGLQALVMFGGRVRDDVPAPLLAALEAVTQTAIPS